MENMFSNTGLTSSEANHITNVTKELVKDIDSKVLNMKLSTAMLNRDGKKYPLDNNEKVDNWKELLMLKGKYYSLSSWLKVAIKLKENMLDNISIDVDLSEPMKVMPNRPLSPNTSFEKYLTTLTVKELNEYYSNESMAAHVGKFVHNFDKFRESIENFQPTQIQQLSSGDTAIIEQELLYSKQELLDGYFDLQKTHRNAEKVVNLYKSRYKKWSKEIEDKYYNDLELYQKQVLSVNMFNNRLEEEASNKRNALILKEKERISSLKIIIPNDLQPTLDAVLEYSR